MSEQSQTPVVLDPSREEVLNFVRYWFARTSEVQKDAGIVEGTAQSTADLIVALAVVARALDTPRDQLVELLDASWDSAGAMAATLTAGGAVQ